MSTIRGAVPATVPAFAAYDQGDGDIQYRRIHLWDEDGDPWVIDGKRLVPASDLPCFARLTDNRIT